LVRDAPDPDRRGVGRHAIFRQLAGRNASV
jgi:hypothetical protein